MPAIFAFAGRLRLPFIAGSLLLILFFSPRAHAVPQRGGTARPPYEKAQRMREALEGRPEHQRTRRQYDRVIDAYRAVYHNDPASPRADAAITAVADLLAEEGRVFQDEKALHDAIGQYEFLRKAYPGSRYRFSALLTIGEIYLRDLDDRDNARLIFQQFLRLYPQNPLAGEARVELNNMRHQRSTGAAIAQRQPPVRASREQEASSEPPQSASTKHRNTVLTAAIQSQEQRDARSSSSSEASAPRSIVPRPTVFGSTVPKPASKAASQPASGMQETDIPPPAMQSQLSTDAPTLAADQSPARSRQLSDAVLNAPPPPRRGRLPLVTGIRHWSTPVYTRVAIDLQDEVQYEAVRVPNPDRIFFDLHGARLSPELIGRSVEVIDDGFLKKIRAAQFSNDVTRIVLDVSDVSEYSAFFLPNPSRLIIDVHGRQSHTPPVYTASAPPAAAPQPSEKPVPEEKATNKDRQQNRTVASNRPTIGLGTAQTPVDELGTPVSEPRERSTSARTTEATRSPASTANAKASADTASTEKVQSDASALADVATLGRQPNRVKATKQPTTAPVAQSVAGTTPASQPDEIAAANTPPAPKSKSRRTAHTEAPPVDLGAPGIPAQPTADGQRSLVRTLGLKINRIVVDAGHGGHDSGTLGPGGIEEKDVALDVALRLGALLKQKLGADVIYTRDDDTFIPLETRTAIANKAQADLFISIHANSSSDPTARGVETYYLNFTTSADALETAARENAVSDESIHQLSDLVKKIALQDKINESKEFASDVQQSLYSGLEDGNLGLKDRGVKKAPFVVLIGANMPSILTEISFLTNPSDAQELRDSKYRERIAESIYRGVARYVGSLSGVRIADASSHGTK
jgi:N-acetylmuramoyl-L-alanine amidase